MPERSLSSTVAMANPGATVVLDDLAARGEADRLGIPKIGTLRLLLDAKQLGIIPSILTPLDRLREMVGRKCVGNRFRANWWNKNRLRFPTHFHLPTNR